MKTIKRLICWLKGHNINHYESGSTCERCGEWHEWNESVGAIDNFKFWWKYHRPNWLRPLKYFCKCRDCGKRFAKHTEDCPPF